MKRPFRPIRAAVLCLTLGVGCTADPLEPRTERAQAEDAIDAWIGRHPDGWAGAARSADAPTRPSWTPACSDPASPGYVSLRLDGPGGEIELAFRCPLDERATVEQLQTQFVRAVPWDLPTGIRSPNWRFQTLLTVASIYDGVTFHTPSPGLLAVDINSMMRGVMGTSTRCPGTAVAYDSLPDACVVLREHRVRMQMRYTVPAVLTALR